MLFLKKSVNMGTLGNRSNTSIEDSSKYLNSLQYLIGSYEFKNTNYSLTNVNVFKFDNTLFKTPMPNPGIIQETNIGILTEEPDALSSLNWFNNTETLEPLARESSEFLKSYTNQTLCELIDIKNDNSINILYVNRIPEIFKDIILEIIKKLNLKFDLIYIKEETFYLNQFLFSIMKIYPNLKEISYYSNNFNNYIVDKQNSNISNNLIENFKIEVPFQFSYLLPSQERQLLDKIVLKTRLNNTENKLIISTGVFWSLYRLDFDSKMSLLRIFNDRKHIETSSNENFDALTFNCDGLLIAKNQLSLKTLKLLGGYNKSVVLTPSFFGYIKDKIYAVKVIINDESPLHLHESPIIIIARSPDATLIEANNIDNWTVVDEYITLSAKISYNRRIKLTVDSGV